VGWHVDEKLGRRIAAHRAKLALTQQELADRLGVSRVAVSHLEAGLSVPGERTVALLAGVFKVEPHELVAGTDYPSAKAERLPVVVARHTEADLAVALCEADLAWLDRLGVAGAAFRADVRHDWEVRLAFLIDGSHDRRERAELAALLHRVRSLRT